jgi:hypothetical protein
MGDDDDAADAGIYADARVMFIKTKMASCYPKLSPWNAKADKLLETEENT